MPSAAGLCRCDSCLPPETASFPYSKMKTLGLVHPMDCWDCAAMALSDHSNQKKARTTNQRSVAFPKDLI
eukprot:1371711-Ditylum_brightwellii.AAC.1